MKRHNPDVLAYMLVSAMAEGGVLIARSAERITTRAEVESSLLAYSPDFVPAVSDGLLSPSWSSTLR